MRLIKGFLFVLTGLAVMITLFSLLIPSNVKISRSVIINDTTGKIITQLTNLKNWKNWHPIFMTNDATINYLGNGCDIVYHNKTTHLTLQSTSVNDVQFLLQSEGENDIENEILVTP